MIKGISKEILGLQRNVLLSDYTSYKIGGPAKYFLIAKTKENLLRAIEAGKKFKMPIFILGGGSNLLVSDKGFNGLVIKIDIQGIEFKDNLVVAGAGFNLTKLAYEAADKGLSGLEWAAGIPGATIGGAVYGHAQAFGVKVSDSVKSVEVLDLKNLKVKNLSKEQCKFSLKNSIFKKKKTFVIVSVVLELAPKNPEEIKNKIDEFLNYRKNRHPINFPSAGSTFVNPEIKIKNKKLLELFPELKDYNVNGTIPAGYLISKCGLAGKQIGGAQIAKSHANFIINLGGAKAKDVLKLMGLAKSEVKKKFNVNLETEVQLIGF